MSKKRRTRKDKINAKKTTYSLSSSADTASSKVSKTSSRKATTKKAPDSLYAYDTSLIRKDLIKTVLVSTLVMAIEISLFFYWS